MVRREGGGRLKIKLVGVGVKYLKGGGDKKKKKYFLLSPNVKPNPAIAKMKLSIFDFKALKKLGSYS